MISFDLTARGEREQKIAIIDGKTQLDWKKKKKRCFWHDKRSNRPRLRNDLLLSREPTLRLFVDIAWNDSKTQRGKNKRKPTFRPNSIVRPVSFIIFLDLVHAVPISSLSPPRSRSRSSSTVTTSRRLTRFLCCVRGGGGICHPSGLKHVKNVKNMKIFNPVQKFRKESFFWILVVDENYWRCFLEIAYFWELKIFRSSIFCYTN